MPGGGELISVPRCEPPPPVLFPSEPRYFPGLFRPVYVSWVVVRMSVKVFPFESRKRTFSEVFIMAGTTTPRRIKPAALDILPDELKFTRGHVLVRPESSIQDAVAARRGTSSVRDLAKQLGTSEPTLNSLMSGKKVRRDAAVRVVVALGLANEVTFLAADEHADAAKPVEDADATTASRALMSMLPVPPFEFIARQHNEHPKGGWLSFFKELWLQRETHRHRESMVKELFDSSVEQLRASPTRDFEEVLHRLLDRFLPREEA